MTLPSTAPVPTIAVIGGGASGTLLTLHLLAELRRTAGRAEIVLVDRDGRHGLGRAYATTDGQHLLNAPAGRMSALEGDPGHFARWAAARRGEEGNVPGGDFLPRAAYGRYLVETLREAVESAWPHVRVRPLTGEVARVREPSGGRRARVHLADGTRFDADAVVLATGCPPPAAPRAVAAAARLGALVVADPWAPGALDGLAGHGRVLVVGGGLTMLDLALTLCARPGVEVHAVSRSGLLPRTHAPAASGTAQRPAPLLALPPAPARLGEILRAVRLAVEANGGDWRPVVDALRPHVPALWAAMPAEDQRRFLALLARPWEVHRHRIPPATATRADELLAAGRLRLHRGRLAGLGSVRGPHPWCATLTREGVAHPVAVDAVVLATGPGPVAADPLPASLLAGGTVRADHLGLGFDAMPDGSLRAGCGRVQPWLSTLGPPLRGLRWETTAIPEIRDQAAALAYRLVRTLAPGRHGRPATPLMTNSHVRASA